MTQQDNDKNQPEIDMFAKLSGHEISARLGYDLRDLWIDGYTNRQINGVLTGRYSLQELLAMEPERKSGMKPVGKSLRDRAQSLWKRLWRDKTANSQSESP